MLTLPEKIVFAVVVAASIGYFVRRGIVLVRLLKLGQPDPDRRHEDLAQGIVHATIDVLSQRKVLRKPWVGLFHILIVWGFFIFAVNTINHFLGAFLPGFHLFGQTKLALYYTSLADVFAVLIILGVLGLGIRRHVFRPVNLTRPSVESALVLICIGGAMVAYLLNHSVQMALGNLAHPEYHVASAVLAGPLVGLSAGALSILSHVAWWCDALMHLLLVALLFIPTKHMHLVYGPINLALMRTRPRGQMSMMDLEDEDCETFGVSKIEEYSWKQNLDLYACIECGRCQDFCPTHNSDKPLKPKHLIVDLKHYLLEEGPKILACQNGKKADGEEHTEAEVPALIEATISKDTIWACTTCGACVEHCPMGIEHVDKLTDLRRHLVLMEADFPEQADLAFRNMETAGNPWGLAPAERAAWAKGLDVPLMAEKKQTDILWWVGCSGSYDDRSKQVSVAMAKILQHAGVDFAILGEEERCHCESARRLGNEYLFQTVVQEIAETLKQYEFKRILVTCPHCLNTFQNEFPAFGAKYEVVHHTAFLSELLDGGRLQLGHNGKQTVVYHDSCYLGRYNGLYDAPRDVLRSAGANLTRPPRQREHGFCCGAGGGRMWLEEDLGQPICQVRAEELLTTGAHQVAAACPFCITMLTDGIKKEEREDVHVRDIAEFVLEAMESAD